MRVNKIYKKIEKLEQQANLIEISKIMKGYGIHSDKRNKVLAGIVKDGNDINESGCIVTGDFDMKKLQKDFLDLF